MTDPLSLIPATAFVKHQAGKFASKLNEAERCEILALVKAGVRRDRVAAAYNVDRRTVTHIVNPASPHYKAVRKHHADLGHDAFLKKYLTEDVAQKIAALPDEPEDKPAPRDPNAPNARSNRLAGIQQIDAEDGLRAYPHKVEIKYLQGEPGQAIEADGWYFRDLDSNDPNTWFHNGPDSRKTSQACYEFLVENLMDE